MYDKIIQRVRLIQSDEDRPPVGSVGLCSRLLNGQYFITWENKDIQVLDQLWSDTFHVEPIIEGYDILTMHDVLMITAERDDELYAIKDIHEIQNIYQEYIDFTEPLVQLGLEHMTRS